MSVSGRAHGRGSESFESVAAPERAGSVWAKRPYAAPVALAVAAAVLTVIVAVAADLPVRDPDGIFGPRFRLLVAAVLAMVLIDIVPRAVRRARADRQPLRKSVALVARERWTRRRTLLIATGILSFYVTYVSYRNLKSFLPFVTEQDLDAPLLSWERALFGGDPAILLQDLLGTGVAAHILSSVYLVYLAFVPISLCAALVWSSNMAGGFWYTMALGINWLLGAASYYILPALGPAFVAPEIVSGLSETGVVQLQQTLLESREAVLINPWGTPEVQSIAAFASLHVSVVFSAALIAHLMGLARGLRIALWVFLGLTIVSTVYFGWHYLVDDVAGLAMGALAVYLGGLATGRRFELRPQTSTRLA